jgi:hypothetical protein
VEPTEQDYRWLQRRADRVCSLIVSSTSSDSEIREELFILRHQAAWLFPDRRELYDRIYGSRFRRLWQQFRDATRRDSTPEFR